jgi:tight adherence protein C
VTLALLLALVAAILAAAGVVDIAAGAGEARGARRRGRRLVAGVAGLGRRLGAPAPPADLSRRIEAAGLPLSARVGDVMAVKAGAALVALVAALPLAAALPGRLGPVGVIAAPAAAFLAPDAWLARRTRRRGRAMAAELPDVLDLLRVAVDAGLSPARALGEVGRRRHGALSAELRAAATRIDLGVPRARVLQTLERRCPTDGIVPLVADARARHAHRLRERAARAAPKIQLVIALLLVPAVMLMVGAAMVTALR